MTNVLLSEKQLRLWILCLLLITAAAEDTPCPTGSPIHVSSVQCFWISQATSPWSEAQTSCRHTPGGDLASADTPELLTFIHHSFPVKSTVWVWLRRVSGEESGSDGGCTQVALGALGRWRREPCAGRFLVLCAKQITEALPPLDSYLIGVVLFSAIYSQTEIQPLLSIPDISQQTVEMQLFPGLWFSHAGQLVQVHLAVQPSPQSSQARVQILRPYCDPSHHLVPPGCSSLLNPFSCCSPVPLCNTTGGCSVGQYWCHLLEVCVPNTSPCSPYDSAARGRGFDLPPRYPSIPPFYHLVVDLALAINPSSVLETLSVRLPDTAITVYPDDVIAIQHTRAPGRFLHCLDGEATRNSPWRQSYLSLGGAERGGWFQGGLTSLSQRGQWVDGVVCDLSIMYTDTLHRGTETSGLTPTDTTPRPQMTAPPPTSQLRVIHPVRDQNNRIHVEIDKPTVIVVRGASGQRATSSWSAPVLQTRVPCLSSCPQEIVPSWPGCERQAPHDWFSSATLLLASVGVHTLNISVVEAGGSLHSVSVEVCGYEAVTGLSVGPHGRRRMLTDTSQTFTAKVERGSSVTFTWVVDNLEKFAFEGESYSVAFKRPAEYQLKVTASNPVSFQSVEILLVTHELTPLTESEFLNVREAVPVNTSNLYTVRVKVDISLPVTFRWDFGHGSSSVSHTVAAPCETMDGFLGSEEKQVYIQDSVNYTYSSLGDFPLHVQVSNQFDDIGVSMKVKVRPELGQIHISSSPVVPLVNQTVLLEACAQPYSFGVLYKWEFGHGSKTVEGADNKVHHAFGSAGIHNVTVWANNSLATLTTWLIVDVKEKISGLNISCSKSTEVNVVTEVRGTVATGTGLTWEFDFGDGSLQGNLTDGSVSHVFKYPGNYTVVVTVSNSVTKVRGSARVEVYSVSVHGILPTQCTIVGNDVQLTALVTGKPSSLVFHWEFGDGSPKTVVTGQSTAVHLFHNAGVFYVVVTVFSSASSVSFKTNICVESPITSVAVQPSQEVAVVGEEVCFTVIVSPEQVTGYQYRWSADVSAMTENSRKCFVFKDEGVKDLSVMASNDISNKTTKVSIIVQRPVGELSVGHDSQSNSLTVNTPVSFSLVACSGSNVSVLWDFGDGSLMEQKENVSHVFTFEGQFTVTVIASNRVSKESTSIRVNVLPSVEDLSLHCSQQYAVAGEEILITAASSAVGSTSYFWTVDGLTSTQQGTNQFRFSFPKPGVYQVKVVAQNLVSRKEAAMLIKVFERIEGLKIESPSLTNMEYAPTQVELLFIASVSKGSNVTYHWFAAQHGINREVTGDGEVFHLLADNPGGISLQLRAFNSLGDATSNVSLSVVEPIAAARVTADSNIVAIGKVVNITVSVVAGSDLHYLWYGDFDPSPLRTHVPSLLHNFTKLGNCPVTVVVQNPLSECNATIQFIVQEEVHEVDFEIEGKTCPFNINATAAVSLQGHIHKGTDLHWDWEIRAAETIIFKAANQMLIYAFAHADIYHVSLNVSNGINWQMVSHLVTVQDKIENLLLDINQSSLCSDEEVVFNPTISKGSNVSFVLMLRTNDWSQSQIVMEGQSSSSRLAAGRYVVTLKAGNLVSSAEVSSGILVADSVQGLQLVNCCSPALEALSVIPFKAEVKSEIPVNYTWIFLFLRSKPTRLMGQEVNFAPPESGLMYITVVASNGICSQTLNKTVSVERRVQEIKVICHSERVFVGHTVKFSAASAGGSNVRYIWDFGESTDTLITDLSTVNHTYYSAGKYSVVVTIFNNVSQMSTQLYIDVEELLCSSPESTLVQSRSTIYRSRPSFFEASVDIDCFAYKTTYLWEIFQGTNCTNIGLLGMIKVKLRRQVDTASPFLLLPKRTLNVGQYCLMFTVSLQETPIVNQQTTSFTVVHSPLVAVIKGGSHKLWPSLSDLTLDGSESEDPDVEPGEEDMLEYHWIIMRANSTESHIIMQPIGINSARVTLTSDQLHPGTLYIVTLTVHKAGREPASVNQTVSVHKAPVLPVAVECESCTAQSSNHISYNSAIILSGRCEHCDDNTQYTWFAEDQTGTTLDLDDITTTTGRHSPNLVVRSGALQPGLSYTFTLNASQPDEGRWGSASQTVTPNDPPHGGRCDLISESDIRPLETVVTYNCSGWQDDDTEASQLIYTFQVVPCPPSHTTCPTLTLYRGTRSTFGSLVPVKHSGENNPSAITVTVLVEDHLGSKVTALNRSLTVKRPAVGRMNSQWLRNKSQTELWVLVQTGNPQEIIPYSIALTSQLNQMDSEHTPQELRDKREVRVNVTRALASLPVSSLLDVDQISSALAQATAEPAELVCNGCQEKLLETVGKMIHVMEEQMSPGVSSALQTGRNILHIIGGTMAAAAAATSESASASHPASSSSSSSSSGSQQSASALALSALAHAGALVRTLVQSRVHGREPLVLSTPYISSAGFRGDPSDLLCTHRANRSHPRPCPFRIPASLAARLRNQTPEVVQVLLGTDGELRSDPTLSAADPPISTSLVAMELSTPQGQPIPIRDLDPERAIQVSLPNRLPGDEGAGGNRNETCLTVTLPTDGHLNLTVEPVDGLDGHAGLFISFNFSLPPGSTSVSSGHVRVEVSSSGPRTNASQGSLEREWTLALSALTGSFEESIFLSPLLHGTEEPLSVHLTSSFGPAAGPVRASVCVFSSLCRYYSTQDRRWSSEGLRPLEGSTLRAARCLTQHLTIFGASMFVHPGAVVLVPPSAGPVRNSVVGIVCAVLVLVHLLVGLIAHKLDHLDSMRLSHVPLCGRPGLYQYRVLVKTGVRRGAGTTAHVGISLYGVNKSGSRHLQRDGAFQRGDLDQFHLETDDNLGEVWKIRIWHDNTGLDPSWYVQHVVVWDPRTDHMFFFVVEDWLSVDNQKNETVEREVLASCPEELSEFRRVLSSQLMFGVMERHLWLSLWERPAHSRFTRGQRVTCCALMIHLYLALGALWFGAVGSEGNGGPVSEQLQVNMETVAMGMTIAVLAFPLQCLLCFLFRKAHSRVTVDMSVPPSPLCHSVEMDIYLGQSSPSLLSLPDSSRESPSSLLESKAFDSSILDFWASSGLAPQTDASAAGAWPSCDSLLIPPDDSGPSKVTAADPCRASPDLGPTRQLRRKKALMQLRLATPSSPDTPTALAPSPQKYSSTHLSDAASREGVFGVNAHNHNLATFLTLSEEDLLMSIAAAEDTAQKPNNNSDSGRDSPPSTSSYSATPSTSCSSWSDQTEDSSSSSPYGTGLYKCPSDLSVDSVTSTFLPSPSPDSSRSTSTTRIGVSRGQPSWLLPPWALCVIYPLVAALLASCLAVVGLYGSFFSGSVVLMWLLSTFSAFLTSALLLEPLKVCVQALGYTLLWRPVDPEVEEQLAQETAVVRAFGDHSAKVCPPCGFGLLQAKDEARKVRALRSLMRHCVYQLFFLLLVLMVNYQDSVEGRQGALLQSAVRHRLHTASLGAPNLTSLTGWWDAERWIGHTLVPQLHHEPSLRLAGLPRLQYTHTLGHVAEMLLGNSSEKTHELLADLHMTDWSRRMFKGLSIDFTLFSRDSGLFVCVSVQLQQTQSQRLTPFLSIYPLLIPSSSSGLDLRQALMVLLIISALLILSGELWSMVTERAQYLHQWRHWLQVSLALLSLATSLLQFSFLSLATSCISEFRSRPDDGFIDFRRAALLAQRSSQCAAVLLTLLVLKLLGTLRFVRRWLAIGRVLRRARGDLGALTLLMLMLMLLCTHLGNLLFSHSVEGFLSVREAFVSALSILRGRAVRQRLCKAHAVLGPLYGLLLTGGGLWLLARLCGAVLIRAYRAEQAERYHPTIDPQDYEMVEFFIKRLRLWMGLSRAKEFRHRVKFEGMDLPPSRSSQDSRLSTLSSALSSALSSCGSPSVTPSSPRPPSSALSVRSEDSSASGLDVLPCLDHLLTGVDALLARFDSVNGITEEVHDLEVKLEVAQVKRRKRWMSDEEGSVEDLTSNPTQAEDGVMTREVRRRKTSILYPVSLQSSFSFTSSTLGSSAASTPHVTRTRVSRCESESVSPQLSSSDLDSTKPVCEICPAASPRSFGELPRRRAWHSGSSHSADAAQRAFQLSGRGAPPCGGYGNGRPRSEEGVRRQISDGVPVKRKAWTTEGPETGQH